MAAIPGLLRKWTPGAVPGLRLWIDATDSSTLTMNGATKISQIADKSGWPNQNLVQNNAANQPTIASNINKHQTVSFSSNLFMSSITSNFASSLNNSQYSFYIVNSLSNFSAVSRIMELSNSIVPPQYGYIQNSVIGAIGFYQTVGSLITLSMPNPNTTSNFIIEAFVQSSPNSSNMKLFVMSSNNTTVTAATAGTSYLTNLTNFTIGTARPTQPFLGDLGEIIAFNTSYFQDGYYTPQLEGYFAWKWGMVNFLCNAHPYKNRAPI